MKTIKLVTSHLILFCLLGSYGFAQNSSVEKNACDIFLNKIFVEGEIDSVSIQFTKVPRKITLIISEFRKGNLQIYYDNTANEYTKPYDDSLTYVNNIHDGFYRLNEKEELLELYENYKKRKAFRGDTISVCPINDYYKTNLSDFLSQNRGDGYFIKFYKHIESKKKVFVEIDIIKDLNDVIEFYLVFNKKNEFQNYIIREYH